MSHDEAIHSRGTPHNEIAITSRASSAYNIRVGNGQHASPPHVVQVYNKVIASMIRMFTSQVYPLLACRTPPSVWRPLPYIRRRIRHHFNHEPLDSLTLVQLENGKSRGWSMDRDSVRLHRFDLISFLTCIGHHRVWSCLPILVTAHLYSGTNRTNIRKRETTGYLDRAKISHVIVEAFRFCKYQGKCMIFA